MMCADKSSRWTSSQLAAGDADLVERASRIPDHDSPLAVRLQGVLDIAGQPLGLEPGLAVVAKFLTSVILVRFAVGNLKKVSRHRRQLAPRSSGNYRRLILFLLGTRVGRMAAGTHFGPAT